MSEEPLYPPTTREDLEAKAAAVDCDLIVAEDCELTLDLDSPAARATYEKMKHYLNQLCKVLSTDMWESRSGNTHVFIRIDSFPSLAERVAIQAILGSDPHRELLNLRDSKDGASVPNCLFRPKKHGVFRWRETSEQADKRMAEIFGETVIQETGL